MTPPRDHPLVELVAPFLGLLTVGLVVANIVSDRIEGWWERFLTAKFADFDMTKWGEG